MTTLFARRIAGRYIGLYLNRSCTKLWGSIWMTTAYFDKCYIGKRLISMPGYGPIKIEWV